MSDFSLLHKLRCSAFAPGLTPRPFLAQPIRPENHPRENQTKTQEQARLPPLRRGWRTPRHHDTLVKFYRDTHTERGVVVVLSPSPLPSNPSPHS